MSEPVVFGAWAAAATFAGAVAISRRADRDVTARVRSMDVPRGRPSGAARVGAGSRWGGVSERLRATRWFDDALVRRRLVLAGLDDEVAAIGLAAVKLRWGASGALLGLAAGGGGARGAALGAVCGLAGFRLPDVRLARRAAARQAQIERGTPDLCDLLAAAVAAGIGPGPALELAAESLRGPLADELRRAVARVAMGTRWSDALEELASRSGVDSVRRLCAALAQTDRLGASLESVLRGVARDGRAEARARAESRARGAPVKLLFPLVFLILPAFLLLTVVPVVLATLRNL